MQSTHTLPPSPASYFKTRAQEALKEYTSSQGKQLQKIEALCASLCYLNATDIRINELCSHYPAITKSLVEKLSPGNWRLSHLQQHLTDCGYSTKLPSYPKRVSETTRLVHRSREQLSALSLKSPPPISTVDIIAYDGSTLSVSRNVFESFFPNYARSHTKYTSSSLKITSSALSKRGLRALNAFFQKQAIPHSALSDIEVSAFLDQIHSKAHTQQFIPHTLLSSTESAETTYFIMGLLHIAECKTTNTHPIWNELPTLYLSNQALRLRHFSLAQKTKVLFEKSVHTQTKQTPFETPGSILTKFISQIHISAQELFSLLHKKTLSNIALRALSFSGQEPIITVESTEDADLIALLATDDNPNISNSVSRTLRKEACSTHHEEYLGKSKTSHAVQIF